MNGILLINKPQGFTSFDVVAKLRGILKTRKIGHAGTLDPLATGLLPIFVGNAARANDLMPNSDKEYIATIKFGITTDTQDITGTVLSEKTSNVTSDELLKAIEPFIGEISQIPPMFSAIKQNGKKLYELARAGIEVKREPREIFIKEIELISFDDSAQTAKIRVSCSKGTYIRTLCFDIGEALNCGAVMSELVRTRACGFNLENALTFAEVEEKDFKSELLIPVDEIFMVYEKLVLDSEQTPKYLNGLKLRLELVEDGLPIRVYSDKNIFLGLAKMENGELKIVKNLGEREI